MEAAERLHPASDGQGRSSEERLRDPEPQSALGLTDLPEPFAGWLATRGWRLRRHQAEMLAVAGEGRDALLIAPTGGGKTLGGFLPSLVELAGSPGQGRLHTLYISPLKALTNDIARNLERPVGEMGLKVTFEVRTGDTPSNRRQRQRRKPPDILLTTPESLALLIAYPDAHEFFANLRCVILDELHAMADGKRGALLSLGLARLRTLAPEARFTGLSATVARPDVLARYLSPDPSEASIVRGEAGAEPSVEIFMHTDTMPWGGHMALYAMEEVYRLIEAARTVLVFVNTRAQAELAFGALWRINKSNLPIALHHGSLDVEQRRRVEAAMGKGGLRAVICTSSLDLGIDWGDVDLVVQLAAPKGSARMLQRIGRANHRLDEPSRAILVPGNRFEVLECMAAKDAMEEGDLDGGEPTLGGLDVLAQHVTGTACAGPFDALKLFDEIRTAAPYADLPWEDLEAVIDFCATGGYALRAYERYRRLERGADGLWRLIDKRAAQQYRMNVGTIVQAPTLHVRLGMRGRRLGEIEEMFVASLRPGDTFAFAGRFLAFEGIRDGEVVTSTAKPTSRPLVASYAGSKFPMSAELAQRVRTMLAQPTGWDRLPPAVHEWLAAQARRSHLAGPDEMLVETFERRGRHFLVAYPFAGRNAHQTLGMLLTRRMERRGLRPQGFVATDYNIAVWGLKPAVGPDELFHVDMLGDDLEEWMAESTLIKRTFRNCAVVAGLIERRHPGQEKSGRQVNFNADLIYDVLRKHDPDHILLRAARDEAARGMTDIRRLADLLVAIQGRIRHVPLDRISPFAVSIIAGIGKEFVADTAVDEALDEITAELVAEAMSAEPAVAA